MIIQKLANKRSEAAIWVGLRLFCMQGATHIEAMNNLFGYLQQIDMPKRW